MRHERTEELSAYLDGELSPDRVEALERRLAEDPGLARLLAELAAVRSGAAALEPAEPDRDLWPGIAERIRTERVPDRVRDRARRTFAFTIPQLAAAAVALLALGSGAMWAARQAAGDGATNVPALAGEIGRSAGGTDVRPAASAELRPAARTPDDAIADLERRLVEGRGGLDSSTVRVLEESLATIDRAIDQATRALALDPGNAWLTRHLAGAKARKVRLLERANALAMSRT